MSVYILINIETYVDLGIPHLKKPQAQLELWIQFPNHILKQWKNFTFR